MECSFLCANSSRKSLRIRMKCAERCLEVLFCKRKKPVRCPVRGAQHDKAFCAGIFFYLSVPPCEAGTSPAEVYVWQYGPFYPVLWFLLRFSSGMPAWTSSGGEKCVKLPPQLRRVTLIPLSGEGRLPQAGM